ncbi:dapper 2-like, partial [Clarias magur]
MRGRFRAALAGLLELEVLRVKHKEMVESVLGKHSSPDDVDDLLTIQSGLHEYWVEESSLTLKFKRSSSHENFIDVGNQRTFLDLRRMYTHTSSEPHHLHDLHSHECEDRQSR